MSEETRTKIAMSLTGRKIPPEVIEKISKSKIGFRHTEETKEKISNSRRGKKKGPHTEETRRKISKNKAKYQYEVTDPEGNVYTTSSLNMFCKDHGLLQSHMSSVARGEMSGYKGWRVRIIRDLRAASGEDKSNEQWHTSEEKKAQRKERKRLYDKARYQRGVVRGKG